MRTETTISPSMQGQAAAPGLVRRAVESYTRVFNRLAETDWTPRRLAAAHALAGACVMLAAWPSPWTAAAAALAAGIHRAARREKGGAR